MRIDSTRSTVGAMRASSLPILVGLCLTASACDTEGAPADAFLGADAAAVDGSATDAASDLDAATSLDAAASDDASAVGDAASAADASPPDAAADLDAAFALDAASTPDAPSGADAFATRRTVSAEFCPSMATAAGLYRGTLASNLNDIDGACGVAAPGRDGSLRVMLSPGQTLVASYRHAGDGIVYLLERCPVVASCVASADATSSGAETLRYTHTGAVAAPFYLVLDSDSIGGPQTFEVDLELTGP
jgi:hypothetical protein